MKCCPKLPDEQKQIFRFVYEGTFCSNDRNFDFRLSRISDDEKIRLSCSPFSLTVYIQSSEGVQCIIRATVNPNPPIL